MSSKFRKYVEDRLAGLEEEAALLRNALNVLTDFEREDEFFAAARSVSKDDAGVPDSTGSNAKDPEADVTAKATRKATTRKKPAVKKTCSKRGCTNVVVAKGLCRKHYDRANPRSSRSRKRTQPAILPPPPQKVRIRTHPRQTRSCPGTGCRAGIRTAMRRCRSRAASPTNRCTARTSAGTTTPRYWRRRPQTDPASRRKEIINGSSALRIDGRPPG